MTPPPLLYVRGSVELLNRHLISIVGSRRPTPYGNQMAEKLAKDLADRGMVIDGIWARSIWSARKRDAADLYRPKQLIKQGAKLVTGWENVIEELPTPIRADLLPVEPANSEQPTMLVEQALAPNERILYDLLAQDEARLVHDLVERSGLTSSEVLASRFDLELKGVVRQLPGKQFLKVLW
jgi:predicted Rossmann fold nucleotide-binding protein DprA/Smf involved in DNA uptake